MFSKREVINFIGKYYELENIEMEELYNDDSIYYNSISNEISELIGAILYRLQNNKIEILYLLVREDYRYKGVGRNLIESLLLKHKDINYFYLLPTYSAHSFYLKLGFDYDEDLYEKTEKEYMCYKR